MGTESNGYHLCASNVEEVDDYITVNCLEGEYIGDTIILRFGGNSRSVYINEIEVYSNPESNAGNFQKIGE